MSKSTIKAEKGKVLFEKAEIEEKWYIEKHYAKDHTITASFTCRKG
jgi:hypothetical protein